MKKRISTPDAPEAIGPYSQGISMCRLIFVSGQIPVVPTSGETVSGIKEQTLRSLENMKAVIKAAGSDVGSVLKVTVYLKDMNDFAAMNEVYGKFFPEPFPARTCVEVSRLPKDVLVEMEAIAAAPDRETRS